MLSFSLGGSWCSSSSVSTSGATSIATSSTSISTSSSSSSVSTSASSSASSSSVSLSSWTGGSLFGKILKFFVEFDEWGLDEISLWPEIWGKESVGLLQALEESSAEILSGSGLSGTCGVNIIDTSELQDFLGNLSGNATSSSWSWDESNRAGTALSLNLGWDGMDTTDSGTPISSSDWDKVDLSIEKSTLNGDLDFLSDLDTDTDVTLSITGSDDSLESSSLSSLGLLLDGENAHDLIGELVFDVTNKSVDDWCLLDWDGVGIDLFERLDVSGFDESSELGEWGPFFLESTSTSSSSSEATSSSSATSIASSTSASSEASITTFWCWGSFSSWGCSDWSLFRCTHIYNVFFLRNNNN
jgi:hypothetical protein